MAKLTKNEILSAVEEMTVLELSDLVKALEEKFGVSAAPVAVTAATGATADAGEAQEEQTVFDVIITEAGANKIGAIKAVRELVPTLGLVEAKTLVESAPKEVLTGLSKSAAEEAKKKLEAAGAKAELK
ncbi:MAG: 50S ribosomal protein L7/L12 [Candidatus Gottesmanbacteria bacterium]